MLAFLQAIKLIIPNAIYNVTESFQLILDQPPFFLYTLSINTGHCKQKCPDLVIFLLTFIADYLIVSCEF